VSWGICSDTEAMSREVAGARSLLSVCMGNLVELYDFAVFGASAAVLALVVTAGQGGLTSVFVVLAASLFVRPVGAVVVGRVSDRVGRRVPFLAMTLLTCTATALVGLLPPAARAGAYAALGLALLRLTQAFCTGGETSSSVTYLFEGVAPSRRGLAGGFHLTSSAAGMALGLGAVLAVDVALTPAQLLTWGWRLPFLAAVPLALAVFGGRRRLRESTEFVQAQAVPSPRQGDRDTTVQAGDGLTAAVVMRLIRHRPRTVLSGVLVSGAFSVTVTLWFVYVPAYLLATGRATAFTALGPAAAGLLATAVIAPLAGALSDRLGRRPLLIGACIALSLLWPTTLSSVLAGTSWVTFTLASLGVGAALAGFVLASYLPEAFPTFDRATGVGLTYGVGSGVFGGLAPLLAGWLLAQHRLTALALYPVLCAAAATIFLAWSIRRPDPVGVLDTMWTGAHGTKSSHGGPISGLPLPRLGRSERDDDVWPTEVD
jgi:MHS family proline/betaine transporter-like MFS transporter